MYSKRLTSSFIPNILLNFSKHKLFQSTAQNGETEVYAATIDMKHCLTYLILQLAYR